MKRPWLPIAIAINASFMGLIARPVEAKVVRIEVQQRLPYADGLALEEVGPYQRLLGRVHFVLDPQDAANQQIVDLQLAPRNKDGLVEFSADLEILAPVDLGKANGTLLYDVNNRGRRLALGAFQTGNEHFLVKRGYIVVWSGWIAQVLPVDDLLRMDAPVATDNGRTITSRVREEMIVDEPRTRMTISQWVNQGAYEPTEAGLPKATLTWRMRETDPRVRIPRDQWQLEAKWIENDGRRGQLPLVECVIPGGFRPGYIYELIYEAQNPVVQGCGLAGIRDLVSYVRHGADADEKHPLRLAAGGSAAKWTIGYGTSQSGRCLRQMLYDGFNADEQGRRVFDGMMPHVAGGGLGFFNHHFAQPTRHNGQHDNHLYPVDVFPFTYGDEQDPFTKQQGGILRRARAAGVVPKLMHTQCSAEYWHRSGSLVHTDPRGVEDAKIPDEVRIYGFGGSQHSAGSGLPAAPTVGEHPLNPTDYRSLLRALLVSMDEWVRDKSSPPDSVYPRLSEGTLKGRYAGQTGWRPLPGVRYPEVIQQPPWLNLGPDFDTKRHITIHPPGQRIVDLRDVVYPARVPAYGPDNNERGMLLLPSISVPVATYTGWNLRSRQSGAEGELLGLMGSYLPFSRTKADRERLGDPRPALLERYRDFDDYLAQYKAAAEKLIEARYVLAEDLPLLVEQAKRHEPLFKP